MKRDDPIAQLRALDPADAKELDALLAAVESSGALGRIVAPAGTVSPGRARLAVVAAGAAAVAIVVAALVANPFGGSATISSAEAEAQVARALGLQGPWHVKRIVLSAEVNGSARPRFSRLYSDDIWHATDGRLVITNELPSGDSSTTLYANGERRSYDSTNTLAIHRFVSAADLRDEVRSLVPPTAAELYRAADRLGKVRLAGIETLHGRRVYRLAFDWLGSHYVLLFDADRKLPISSESRSPAGPGRFSFTRIRYAAYGRVRSGPSLDRRFALPPASRSAKIVRERPIVLAAPVLGGSAQALVGAIRGRFPGESSLRATEPARATYALIHGLPGGGQVALARIPNAGRDRSCAAVAEFAHPGGEVRVISFGCGRGGTSFSPSQTGAAMIVGGSTRRARSVELSFAGGEKVRADVRDGMFLAAPPLELFATRLTLLITNRDGSSERRQAPALFAGALPDWLTR
jgi:hypothetical protein